MLRIYYFENCGKYKSTNGARSVLFKLFCKQSSELFAIYHEIVGSKCTICSDINHTPKRKLS